VTARQILQEIESLPVAEQQEVFISLQERLRGEPSPVQHLSPETAKPLIKEILTEHSELFRKLAQ
jgi:hypothetical protein